MLRKWGTAALALMLTFGIFSLGEAAESDDVQGNYCRRGSYCYSQNYNRDYNRNAQRNDQYGGDYGCYGHHG